MLKRLTTAAIGVVGLVVIGLGIASATVWRADDVLVATTSGGAHTLVTDPGVLELGGDPVTVKVSVPDGGKVVLAVGRDTDVAGWVGSDAHGQVTGLSAWHTLAVDDVAAPEPTPAPTDAAATEAPAEAATPAPTEGATDTPATAADPTGSDLWVAEETGTGSAELVWPAQEGRWSLIAVSTGESAPTLALAWPRVVTTPWLWPCVVVGTLLVLLAAWLLFRDVRRRRAGLDGPRWHAVNTGATPVVVVSDDIDAIPVLTRRQLREAAQAHATKPRSGSVPQVPAPGTAPAAAPAPAREPAPAEQSRVPVPTATSATSAASLATSRRALRPSTGAIPVTPANPASEHRHSAGAWTPTAAPSSARTSGPGAPPPPPGRPSGSPAGLSGASGPSGSPAGLSGASGPSGSPAGPSGAAGVSGATAGRSGAPAGWSGAPAGSSPGQSGAPAGPARPSDHSTVPHGRPSWVRGTTGPPPSSSATPGAGPTPVTGPERTGPAGWSAVPPPPGARVRPGSPSGPDSSVHAGRPTWARPAGGDAPPTDDPAGAGSRADAWRRAWGLPPTEGTPDDTTKDTDTRGEQR